MAHILFNDNRISLEEIKKHNELIQNILSGTLHSPQVKKLKGMSYQGKTVYRAKINKKERLIFTYHEHDRQQTLFLLEVNNHNYNKLRRQLTAYEARQYQAIEWSNTDALPVLTQPDVPLTLTPAIAYKGKILILDESQISARQYIPPLVLLGPPGAGKSSILYSMMLRQLNSDSDAATNVAESPILFLSPSERLVTSHQKLYQEDMPELNQAVQFITWTTLLQEHYPNRRLVVEAEFVQWLKKQKVDDNSKIVHYELSLIVALSADKYRQLGQRQCHYSRQDKVHGTANARKQEQLVLLVAQWSAYLQDNNLLDPMVNTLNPQHAQSYTAIYLDETQNLPPVALSALVPRALDCHIVAALDSDQCLSSSPYLHNCLKEILHNHRGNNYAEHQLTLDWRSRPEITRVGNHLLDAKYQMDDGSKRRPYKAIQSARSAGGCVSWVDKSCITGLQSYGQRAGTVVVVFQLPSADERLLINQFIGSNNILTPEQAIGLDFDTVILWNPFSQSPDICTLAKQSGSNALTFHQWSALNALYVSLKRAQERLFIYDKEQTRWDQLAKELLGTLAFNQLDTHTLAPINLIKEETKWQEQVEHHLSNKNYLAAKAIMHTHLKLGEAESAHKIEQAMEQKTKAIQPAAEKVIPPTMTPKQSVAPLAALPKMPIQPELNTPSQENQEFSRLTQQIQRGDTSAINRLLQSKHAEYFLFDASGAVLEWLCKQYQKPLATSLKNILGGALKSTKVKKTQQTPLPLMKFLCRKSATDKFSLLAHMVLFIDQPDKNLIKFIKQQKITPEQIFSCCNELYFLQSTLISPHAILKFRLLKALDINPATLIEKKGKNLACMAAERGHTEVLKFFHQEGISLTTPDDIGVTPALIATQNGHLEVLKFFHQEGISLTTSDNNGATPALIAALNGHLEVLKFFHQKEISLTTSDNNGATPALIAAQNGHLGVLKFFHQKEISLTTPSNNGATPVLMAALNGQLEVLKFFHQKEISLTTPDNNGATPAYAAAQNGRLEVLKFFHQKEISLTTPSNIGTTPAYAAAQNSHLEILNFFHQKGISLTTPSNNGTTPALIAALNGHLEVLKFFHLKGISLTTSNNNGANPAYAAAQNGQLEVLKFFHQKGISLTTPDNNGATPAYAAAQNGHLNIIRFLLEKNACKPIPIRSAITEFNEFISLQDSEIQNRAKIFLRDKIQSQKELEEQNISILPYEIAQIMGHTELAAILEKHTGKHIKNPGLQIGFFSKQVTPHVSINTTNSADFPIPDNNHGCTCT